MSLMFEKKWRIFLYVLIVVIVSFFAYFATNSFIFLLITIVLFSAYFIFYECKYAKRCYLNSITAIDANNFIHHFLSIYLINHDIDKALAHAKTNVSKKVREEIILNQEYPALEQLQKLCAVFTDSFYRLFVNVININSDMAIRYLNEENLKHIHMAQTNLSLHKKTISEFIILWACAFTLLIIMRLAIRNYFIVINVSPFYLVAIALFFLFFLFSLHLLFRQRIKKEKL